MRLLVIAAVVLVAFTVAASAADLSKFKPWTGDGPPPLALSDLDGKPHALSDYRGKVIVVNFWATWCGPCVKEMPDFEQLANNLSDEKFAFLAVNFGEKPDRIKPFMKKIGVDVPVLLDTDMETSKAWVKSGLPTTYVIDKDQEIRYQVLGALEWASPEVEAKIREMLPR